jgi:hypothetical protein
MRSENLISEKNDDQKVNSASTQEPDRRIQQKQNKQEKKAEKDRELLGSDRWLVRNGHGLTYLGLYLFSILVLFRPYELFRRFHFCRRRHFTLPPLRLPFSFRCSF